MLLGIILLIVGIILLYNVEKITNDNLQFGFIGIGGTSTVIGAILVFISIINVVFLADKYGESYNMTMEKQSVEILLNDSNVVSRPDGLTVINRAISVNNTIKSWKHTNDNPFYYGLAPITSIDTILMPKFINSSEVRIKQ